MSNSRCSGEVLVENYEFVHYSFQQNSQQNIQRRFCTAIINYQAIIASTILHKIEEMGMTIILKLLFLNSLLASNVHIFVCVFLFIHLSLFMPLLSVLVLCCFFFVCFFVFVPFLQKTAFSLVKSRLALGSPGWLFVCHHAKNGLIHKMVVDCPIVITSIGDTLFRRDQTRNEE